MQISMDEFTLTMSQIYAAAGVFVLILTLISLVGIATLRKEPKRMAWVITSFNAFIMSALGIHYLIYVLPKVKNFFAMPPENIAIFEGRNDFAVLMCLWFALVNVFDIGVGLVFYRKYLGLLTAYIHHSVFIWIMFACTTGNGLFMTVTPFSPSFSVLMIEELPTFVLAIGSLFPSLRSDLGFGLTFFIFRLCYHIFFYYYAIKVDVNTTELVLFAFTTLMHANWFYAWVSKYGSKDARIKTETNKKAA